MKSIVLADMKNYSDIQRALEESLSVSAARDLDAWIAAFILKAVVAAGGDESCVLKGTGDGAILCFDAADKALSCAQHLHEAAAAHNAMVSTPIAKRLFRTGIATGPIAARDGGLDWSGMTISRAARMEGAALPGGVLIDEATWHATSPGAREGYAGPESVKGKRDEAFTAWRAQVDESLPGAPRIGAHAARMLLARKALSGMDAADLNFLMLALNMSPGKRPADTVSLDRQAAALLTWVADHGHLDALEALL